ncbi:YARHG domain-containing protein [Lutibacter sp. B2]|nr:YARHG domain-containing protein [Lutibacter sp. B2]
MKCRHCEKEITNNDKFCVHCGATIEKENKPKEINPKTNKTKTSTSKENKRFSKGMITGITVLCLCVLIVGFFRTQFLSFTYTKLAQRQIGKDFDTALKYGEKAYALNHDSEILENIYVNRATGLVNKNPEQAVKYLKKANEYTGSATYNPLIAKAYLSDAKEKLEYDPDDALELVEEAIEYDKTKEALELYVKVCFAKADQDEVEDIDQSIKLMKVAFKYDKSKKVREKLVGLYLKKAERIYDFDMQGAIEIVNKAKLYGKSSNIDAFLANANKDFYNIGLEIPTSSNWVGSNEYIIYDSAQRELNDSDLSYMYEDILRLARNEIFARHGYVFKSPELQSYFDSKTWYNKNPSYDGYLNEIEKHNIECIKAEEERR